MGGGEELLTAEQLRAAIHSLDWEGSRGTKYWGSAIDKEVEDAAERAEVVVQRKSVAPQSQGPPKIPATSKPASAAKKTQTVTAADFAKAAESAGKKARNNAVSESRGVRFAFMDWYNGLDMSKKPKSCADSDWHREYPTAIGKAWKKGWEGQ